MWKDKWVKQASEAGFLDIPLRLTLIDLLLRPMGNFAVRAPILCIAALGLIHPGSLRAPITWLALTILIGLRLIDYWPLSDNHIYLLGYWCLAVFLAITSKDAFRVISISSRLLLGLAFALATIWKVFLSPDYMDGRFFRIALTQDDRFAHAAMLFGGLSKEDLLQNRQYLHPLPAGAKLLQERQWIEPPAFSRLILFFTWVTVLVEAAVAFFQFIPGARLFTIRHSLLLGFCLITYAFAPVAGFGWLLLILGMSQCSAEQKNWRRIYAGLFLLVLLYSEVPWLRLLWEQITKV